MIFLILNLEEHNQNIRSKKMRNMNQKLYIIIFFDKLSEHSNIVFLLGI